MAPEPFETSIRHGAFRYANYDTPFWSRPNTRPGRWHIPADGPTQYLSMSPAGAWAELIRYEELRTEDEVAQIKTKFWVIDLNVGHLADYSTFEAASATGFDPDALVAEDYSRCQAEGARLRGLGYRGVMAPSAALPGAINVTLFGARYSIRWNARPVTTSGIPAAVAAIGAPPPGIVSRVRHYGDAHEELRQYHLARKAADQSRHAPGESSDSE